MASKLSEPMRNVLSQIAHVHVGIYVFAVDRRTSFALMRRGLVTVHVADPYAESWWAITDAGREQLDRIKQQRPA